MTDADYMRRALTLAKLAEGYASPNPMVGCLVVKDGHIIGEGYHHKAGQAHAEVNALNEAGEAAKGATLYVTLEPCAHYGKTPPCAKRVVESGVKRVVIGIVDPNPLVAGKGIAILKKAGIEVTVGVEAGACSALNEHFLTYIQTGRPFITIKSAMSLDGKIATRTGQSKWITDEAARADGQALRRSHDAMLVGIGTILADNPRLTCRLKGHPHQPDIIILDSQGQTPADSQVFACKERHVIICTGLNVAKERKEALEAAGAEILTFSTEQQGDTSCIPIRSFLEELGKRQYTSLLIEGGSQIIASFIEFGQFDKIITYIGNLIIGGTQALPAVGGQGIEQLKDAVPLHFASVEMLGQNIKIIAYNTKSEGAYVYRNH